MFGALWRWLVRVGSGLSRTLNAVLGGDPRETFSARLGRAAAGGNRLASAVCTILGIADPGHCRDSAQASGVGRESEGGDDGSA